MQAASAAPRSRAVAAGRGAAGPTEIPPRGWWSIAKRVFADVSDNRLMTEAAAITFYTLLSIFPALAAMVSLAGLILDPHIVTQDVDALSGVIPGGGMQVLQEQLTRLTSSGGGSLGIGLVFGFAASLWSSNQAMKALFDSLDRVYGEREQRGYVARTLETLGFTVGAIVFALVAMAFVVAMPIALQFVGLGAVAATVVSLLRWPLLLVCVIAFLTLVFRYGPSRRHAPLRWLTWGSVSAAVLWLTVSLLFSWYVANFGSYNRTYGSLGAAIGFMTWIWLSATAILIGAQLDAEMERQASGTTNAAA